jgi:uncharacterized protein (TIGR02246 family)
MNTTVIRREDEAAIRQLVQNMQEGQNRKDGELFASAFAQEHDYIAINGIFSPHQPGKRTPAFTRGSTTRA